jgi:hypothetical protein
LARLWKDGRNAVSHNHTFTKSDDLLAAFLAHLHAKQFPCNLLHTLNFHAPAALAKAVGN